MYSVRIKRWVLFVTGHIWPSPFLSNWPRLGHEICFFPLRLVSHHKPYSLSLTDSSQPSPYSEAPSNQIANTEYVQARDPPWTWPRRYQILLLLLLSPLITTAYYLLDGRRSGSMNPLNLMAHDILGVCLSQPPEPHLTVWGFFFFSWFLVWLNLVGVLRSQLLFLMLDFFCCYVYRDHSLLSTTIVHHAALRCASQSCEQMMRKGRGIVFSLQSNRRGQSILITGLILLLFLPVL